MSSEWEKKLLVGATGSLLLALAFWTAAVSTDSWFHVATPDGRPLYVNGTATHFLGSHSGIWRICKYVYENGSEPVGEPKRKCHYHRFFPSSEFIQKNSEVDKTILNYTRTEITFSLITFCLILMGFSFSLYTFLQPRYMFKRLAGGVHLLAAASALVVVEVVINSVHYEEQYLSDRHPTGALWSFGYSFGLACFTFALLLVCGLAFLVCSRKKKRTTHADEPNILSRT